MPFHIASSKYKSLQYIKSHYMVDPYSWWEIQVAKLDDPNHDWPEHEGYYGRSGGRLKIAPHHKCVEIYKKCKADKNHHLNM